MFNDCWKNIYEMLMQKCPKLALVRCCKSCSHQITHSEWKYHPAGSPYDIKYQPITLNFHEKDIPLS